MFDGFDEIIEKDVRRRVENELKKYYHIGQEKWIIDYKTKGNITCDTCDGKGEITETIVNQKVIMEYNNCFTLGVREHIVPPFL